MGGPKGCDDVVVAMPPLAVNGPDEGGVVAAVRFLAMVGDDSTKTIESRAEVQHIGTPNRPRDLDVRRAPRYVLRSTLANKVSG